MTARLVFLTLKNQEEKNTLNLQPVYKVKARLDLFNGLQAEVKLWLDVKMERLPFGMQRRLFLSMYSNLIQAILPSYNGLKNKIF